jgi:hypothetical protein
MARAPRAAVCGAVHPTHGMVVEVLRAGMKLKDARLCLDCDTLHEDERCPMCASEAFAFLTQWVPLSDDPRRTPALVGRSVVAADFVDLAGGDHAVRSNDAVNRHRRS